MKIKTLLLLGFFLLINSVSYQLTAQNLVRNSGFENVLVPSCNLTADSAGFSAMVADWSLASEGTADLRTTLVNQNCLTHCTSSHPQVHGRQPPYEGNAMIGLYTYSFSGGFSYREYVEIELLEALEVGETYYCELYASRAENFAFSSNNIGMYFSDNRLYQQNVDYINVTPQINYDQVITDTSGWVKISGELVPTSPLKYLTIGNFFDNASTKTELIANPNGKSSSAYYFIDVVLVRKGKAPIQIDTTFCEGDSIVLSPINDVALAWSLKSNADSFISLEQNIKVSPQEKEIYILYGQKDTVEFVVTPIPSTPALDLGEDTLNICKGETKELEAAINNVDFLWKDGSTDSLYTVTEPGEYWLEISDECGSRRDTINFVDDDCECYVFVPNVFTPNFDSLNQLFAPETDCETEEYHLQIYNRWGERLFESYEYQNKWDGSYLGKPVPEGVYFWILLVSENKGGITKRKPMSGTVTLIK